MYWYDDKNDKKVLQNSDIKIITPYNSSVFELQKRIPTIEIGTVDKFQGQEAAVIIYSLASSSPKMLHEEWIFYIVPIVLMWQFQELKPFLLWLVHQKYLNPIVNHHNKLN